VRFIEHTNGYFVPVHRKADIGKLIHFLEDAKYLAKTKTWNIPKTEMNRLVLQKRGFVQQIKRLEIKPIPDKILKTLPPNLYNAQLEALRFLYNTEGNCLLSFSMGMGKTAIALLYVKHFLKAECTIIVCQASIKSQWGDQITKWVDSTDYHIVYGQKPYNIPRCKYIIINYEILSYHEKVLKTLNASILVGDEVQFVSNTKAQRTKAFTAIAMNIGRTLGLSGTPIASHTAQFYPILHILNPVVFTDYFHFTARYCDRKIGRNGWDVTGLSNVEELREHLANIMIRRTKEDSMDMPSKVVIPLLFDMDKAVLEEYNTEKQRAIKEVFGEGNYLQSKASMTYLQYLAYLGKRDAMIAWITDFLSTGEKLVLFANHRKIVVNIQETFKDVAVKYYGGMSQKQKDEAKAQFLGDKQLIIGNTAAMATGLDGFQAVCSNVGFVQLPWTSTTFDQATDRLWRIGQEANVNVFVFMARNSIEQRIMTLLDRSRKMVEQIIDGKEVDEINFLKELVKDLTKNRK